MEKKQAEAEALEKAKAAQRQAGKMTGMTGKDMFDFGGELYADADEEAGEDDWDISRLLARYVSVPQKGTGIELTVQREEQEEREEQAKQDEADAEANGEGGVGDAAIGVGSLEIKA